MKTKEQQCTEKWLEALTLNNKQSELLNKIGTSIFYRSVNNKTIYEELEKTNHQLSIIQKELSELCEELKNG